MEMLTYHSTFFLPLFSIKAFGRIWNLAFGFPEGQAKQHSSPSIYHTSLLLSFLCKCYWTGSEHIHAALSNSALDSSQAWTSGDERVESDVLHSTNIVFVFVFPSHFQGQNVNIIVFMIFMLSVCIYGSALRSSLMPYVTISSSFSLAALGGHWCKQ